MRSISSTVEAPRIADASTFGTQEARSLQPRKAPIPILGVPFDPVSVVEALEMVEQMIASRRPHYVVTANVDFLVQALRDVELRRILFDAHLVLCDGTPLVWASRMLGNPLPERVAGSDLVPLLLGRAAANGHRVFLLGGATASVERARERLLEAHPTLRIVGEYSPPFSELLDMNHEVIAERVRAARPDLLLVSFGAPKQEKWMNMHFRKLGVPVMMGVGGTIDFLAGRLARAPLWMQRAGLEWVFRLLQEPRRLIPRYARDLRHFGAPVFAQWWHLKTRRRSRRAHRPESRSAGVESSCVLFPDWLDMEAVRNGQSQWDAAVAADGDLLLDLRNVQFIDSTGVGLVIRLQKARRLRGHETLLVAPSDAVLRALSIMKLVDFFRIVPDTESARRTLDRKHRIPPVTGRGDGGSSLAWPEEVTAANAERIWADSLEFIRERGAGVSRLEIDLSCVRFLDSSGVGLMLRTRRVAVQEGVQVEFRNAGENVRCVLRLARLEEGLIGA
jgi:N-acetylglucosaminyldiphosphoundecaprenol N-acetyl-beta-D-mannosaminyltransferase